ncbi:MAG: holo-[acyl-carrier-protein] synthase [Desulfovibrionaceae bacterium]|jgi:holo-[acyl-carrier protein] synthase|nr:holo-[acyl-carrier-protein] synthase [Desulfovibrionaceae bacterium]
MIVGLGIDVVELERIRASWERFGDAFARRVLCAEELAALPARNPVPFLAARFAGKEAAVKALGTGMSDGVGLRQVRILALPSGRPVIDFTGRAREVFDALGAGRGLVSLTHGRDTAAAVVVLETE